MPEMSELLKLALVAAKLAQTEILKHYQRDFTVEWKPDATPVTIADKNAETAMRRFFERELPEAGFIGEEFGIENPSAEFQWILDPIDGTKAFVHGVPLFGTLIALYQRNVPLVSVVNLPALGSVLYAVNGGGAFIDGCKVHVSSVGKLSEALVLSGTLNTVEDKGLGEEFKKLRRSARLYRNWGDCYGYYLVAAGRAEVMLDPVVSLWDIAPFPLIFAECGGHFSTLSGERELFTQGGSPSKPVYEGFNSFASTAALAPAVLALFANT